MKKKTYELPQLVITELRATNIICTSNEQLEEGEDIFGTKAEGMYFDEAELFNF